MNTIRTTILGAALALAMLVTPADAQAVTDQTTDPAAIAAHIAAASTPLAVSDFAGGWGRHGIGLDFDRDGFGVAQWRIYRWCNQVGNVEPCDGMKGSLIVNGGTAQLKIERTDGRTAYGTASLTTDPKTIRNGPFTLTEYDYGMGELKQDPPANPDAFRLLLCGPRYGDTAPDWFKSVIPCGA